MCNISQQGPQVLWNPTYSSVLQNAIACISLQATEKLPALMNNFFITIRLSNHNAHMHTYISPPVTYLHPEATSYAENTVRQKT